MKVSVAICTYNGEKYIAQQIKSILEQTCRVNEIIISDDGSTDNTLSVAEEMLRGQSVDYVVLKNKPAKGVAANFLSALKHAAGDYIFTCDQDDVWFPDKVEKFMQAVSQQPADLYFSDGMLVDGECRPLGTNLWEANGIAYSALAERPLFHTVIKNPVVTGAAMLVSKELVARISRIPENWLHDEWLSVFAALSDRAVAVNTPTFCYRQHGRNVVGAKKKTLLDRIQIWLKGFENLHAFHLLRQKKCNDIMTIAEGSRYEALVRDAMLFWSELAALPEMGRWKGLCRITGFLRKGWYTRFYSSYRSYIRDVLFVLFAPRHGRKKTSNDGVSAK